MPLWFATHLGLLAGVLSICCYGKHSEQQQMSRGRQNSSLAEESKTQCHDSPHPMSEPPCLSAAYDDRVLSIPVRTLQLFAAFLSNVDTCALEYHASKTAVKLGGTACRLGASC